MNRREVLKSLGILAGGTGLLTSGYLYIEDKNMKKLKPKEGRIPADLHVHLYRFLDPSIVRKTLSQPGLIGLADYTVPNELLNFYDLRKYPEFREIDPGILGTFTYNGNTGYVLNVQEVTLEHHISALGCKKNIVSMSLGEAIEEIHEKMGLAILNHPWVVPSGDIFRYRSINDDEKRTIDWIAREVDGIEVFNGQCIDLFPPIDRVNMEFANKKAKEYAQHLGYKEFATSDAHWYTQALTSGIFIPDQDLTFNKLKQYIKSGDYFIEGNPVSRISFVKGHLPQLGKALDFI